VGNLVPQFGDMKVVATGALFPDILRNHQKDQTVALASCKSEVSPAAKYVVALQRSMEIVSILPLSRLYFERCCNPRKSSGVLLVDDQSHVLGS